MDDTSKLTQITAELTGNVALLINAKAPPTASSVQPAIDAATAALTTANGSVLTALGTPVPVKNVPSITSATPATLKAGATVNVTIKGAGFTGATGIGGSPALTIANVVVVDDTTITADVTVATGTPAGAAGLAVATPAGQSSVFSVNTTV